jgi:hypothetical protein
MDIPINLDELNEIVIALKNDNKEDLSNKLMLIYFLIQKGEPYKKILREKYNFVA